MLRKPTTLIVGFFILFHSFLITGGKRSELLSSIINLLAL